MQFLLLLFFLLASKGPTYSGRNESIVDEIRLIENSKSALRKKVAKLNSRHQVQQKAAE